MYLPFYIFVTHLTAVKVVFVRSGAKSAVGDQLVCVVHDVTFDIRLEEENGRLGVFEGQPSLSMVPRRREVWPTTQRQLILLGNDMPVQDRRQSLAVCLVQTRLDLNSALMMTHGTANSDVNHIAIYRNFKAIYSISICVCCK